MRLCVAIASCLGMLCTFSGCTTAQRNLLLRKAQETFQEWEATPNLPAVSGPVTDQNLP